MGPYTTLKDYACQNNQNFKLACQGNLVPDPSFAKSHYSNN